MGTEGRDKQQRRRTSPRRRPAWGVLLFAAPRGSRAMRAMVEQVEAVPEPEHSALIVKILRLLDAAEARLATLIKREPPADPPADQEAA